MLNPATEGFPFRKGRGQNQKVHRTRKQGKLRHSNIDENLQLVKGIGEYK